MGLYRRKNKEEGVAARFEQLAAERPFEPEPYAGDEEPDGTEGAINVPGERDVTLAPGKYEVFYRVKGKPAFYNPVSEASDWKAPTIDFSIKPADDATPRLKAEVAVGKTFINT